MCFFFARQTDYGKNFLEFNFDKIVMLTKKLPHRSEINDWIFSILICFFIGWRTEQTHLIMGFGFNSRHDQGPGVWTFTDMVENNILWMNNYIYIY